MMSLFDSSYLRKLTQKSSNPFQKYHDHTNGLIEMLISEVDNPESSFISMIIGATGSGKTALSFIITTILLLSDPTRLCQLFRVQPALLHGIKETAPKFLSDKFSIIEHLREVKPNSILIIDEGLLNANGKEALKLEFRAFEKGLGISRHFRIITILNSQSDGIIKSYRKLAHMIFYKQISIISDLNSKNPFMKKNNYVLKSLKESQTLFQSDYKKFKKWGRIEIDIEDIIPWYNFDISKSYSQDNFDQQFSQEQKLNKMLKELAIKALEFWGNDLMKPKAEMVLSSWIKEQVSFETYYDVKTRIREILSYAIYMMRMKDRTAKQKKLKDPQDEKIIFGKSDFAEFCSKQFESDPIKSKMVLLFLSGEIQKEIASKIKKQTTWTNTQITNFRTKEMGYLNEKWFSHEMGGGETAGNVNKSDYIDPWGNIYSLKCYYNTSKTLTFYQQKDCLPEYREAKKLGKKYYFVFRNPAWRDGLMKIQLIDPQGEEKIVINKSDTSFSIKHIYKMVPKKKKLSEVITELSKNKPGPEIKK